MIWSLSCILLWRIYIRRYMAQVRKTLEINMTKLKNFIAVSVIRWLNKYLMPNQEPPQESDSRNQLLGLMTDQLFKDTDKLKFMISREPHTLFLLWQLLRFTEYLSDADAWAEQRQILIDTFGDWPEMKSLLFETDQRDVCSIAAVCETYKCATSWVNLTPTETGFYFAVKGLTLFWIEKRDQETPYDRIYVSLLTQKSERKKCDAIKKIQAEIIEYFTMLQQLLARTSTGMLQIFPNIR